MSRFDFHSVLFVCLGIGIASVGCAKESGDELGAETETGVGDGETGDGDGDGDALPNISYLFALQTTLGPAFPLLFVLDVVNRIDTPNGETADLVFQPLVLEGANGSSGCVGEPFMYEDVAFDIDGNFDLDMGLVVIPGEANLVTGSDIELTLVVHGHALQPDMMCGEVEGLMMSPLEYDLAGSTFAAVPLDGGCEADPFPPVTLSSCPMP